MDFFHKNQKIILLLVLVAGGLYVYTTFFKSDAASVITQDDITAQQVGAEVIELQNRINSVKLRQELFSSSLYKELVDLSKPILEQPIGRPNPFNLVGFD